MFYLLLSLGLALGLFLCWGAFLIIADENEPEKDRKTALVSLVLYSFANIFTLIGFFIPPVSLVAVAIHFFYTIYSIIMMIVTQKNGGYKVAVLNAKKPMTPAQYSLGVWLVLLSCFIALIWQVGLVYLVLNP